MNMRRGFTLIEVLVALAILAVALAAALRATSASTDAALTLHTRMLAGWVAQNHLNELRARRLFPDVGRSEGSATQGGAHFTWQAEVSASPNRSFRRVEVKVYAGGQTDYAAATLVSYLAQVQR
ncbi:type II secretion system minor pseudopilin GspI [Chitiniphilus purpureus]|uniref:Type II secretion system protein I n=1 Tax=Chitiniphilus purpureus TaxID=2981137 RepID=A0ABY6DMN6_9NEIS|nr:type II secretion system minor pseudopilin GspI [Chitiniphilus sp. CD1]UXY14361.1 type II secretion system minor pseudopilin GspI [Chitiniphilus sp. CD1]